MRRNVANMSTVIENRTELTTTERLRAERRAELGSDAPGLRVTVIATNARGTAAALRTAGRLAADLGVSISLVKMQIIPFEFLLENPPLSTDFLHRQLYGLVCESGIEVEKVTIQLWLCSDRYDGLRKILRPRSLVVIGARKRWWPKEKALERFLTRLGHQLIFVDLNARVSSEPCLDSRSDSVVPMLKSGIMRNGR